MPKKASRSKKKQSKSKINIDLAVVAMLIISILLVVLIYTNSGYIGKILSPMLGGIMGWIKYILPIGTFSIAISIASNKKYYLSSKLVQYAIFLICFSLIMCTFQISKGNILLSQDFGEVIKQAYELGEKNVGGGAIGAIAAVPTIELLGMTGAVILAIGIAIVTLIFIFGIHPSDMVASAVETAKERKEERRQARLEYEEEEEEEYEKQ